MVEIEGATRVTWEARYRLHLPAGAAPPAGWPCVVGLHGFKDCGARLAERLTGLEHAPYARLFPDGPFPLEVEGDVGRRVGYAWYQYTGDQAAFLRSLDFGRAHLRRLVADVAARHGIDAGRVALLGYSQGGYLAGVAGLRDHPLYRGVVGLATRTKVEAVEDVLDRARGFPFLILHGERDRFIPVARQREMADRLLARGVDVRWGTWPGGHGLRADVATRVDPFLREVLRLPASDASL
jgi:phospholipase/carboxylesterase